MHLGENLGEQGKARSTKKLETVGEGPKGGQGKGKGLGFKLILNPRPERGLKPSYSFLGKFGR